MKKSNKDKPNGLEKDSESLSNHLWEAANILRGPVDAADFMTRPAVPGACSWKPSIMSKPTAAMKNSCWGNCSARKKI